MKIACSHCIKKCFAILACCCVIICVHAQETPAKNNYLLSINFIGKDSSFKPQDLKLQSDFNSEVAALEYINTLPSLLASKGYPVASVDSFWTVSSTIYANLYLGTKYNWLQLTISNIDKKVLLESGFRNNNFLDKPINFLQLQSLQERILSQYEKQGYPFAAVYLDSIRINNDNISAVLTTDKGMLYHIDSIRIIGKARISKKFLQRYLYIPNGSPYNSEKLAEVDKRVLELPYLKATQPSDLTMLGTGAVLNLYVQPKKSSQVNFIVGFMPAASNTGKLLLTGDVNLDLKNMLSGGESILLKWQQLQPKSPRLNLGFSQPYIFNSQFGFDFLFDLFKKDSSYLQVNTQLGVQYLLSADKKGKIFLQWQSTTLLSGAVDTSQVISQKKLPPNIDVSSANVGLNYEWIKTNYRYNPRSGNEMNIATMVGIKNIKKNGDIVNIKDPVFDYSSLYDSIEPKSYQLRVVVSGAHYFSLGKFSALKVAANGGFYNSPDIFRNELFQIGGYKLLRGFDEESIYATRYAVGTLEYRNLFDLNSYLFVFMDYGITKNKYQSVNVNNQFLGAGLGLVYEARLGLINISYAVGKRDDVKFSLKESSKIHFGYVNYF
jgi:outer membrane protein assembly factor BamA